MHQNFEIYEDSFKDVFRYKQGSRIGEMKVNPKSLDKMCPECCCIHKDGGIRSGCNYVYGRRGWRQLGVYDG